MGIEDLQDRAELVRRSARTRRLAVHASRYLLLGAVAILAAAGARGILAPNQAPPSDAPVVATDPAAESYALQLARAYLSYDGARPQQRERALRGLLPDELLPDAGLLAGRGSRRVLWAQIAESTPIGATERSIVVAAKTDAAAAPVHLALRVARTRNGALQLLGYPALVGGPAIAGGSLPEHVEVEDQEVAALGRRVTANYLADERANLRADLLPGAVVSLPGTALGVREVLEVVWAGEPASSPIEVTVEASDEVGSLYTLSYRLGIERRRGLPLVSFIETVPTPTRRDR